MEVSFTADRRDCDRAIRNAGLITQVHREADAARHSKRQERPGRNGGGGVRGSVLAPAGRPDAEPRVNPLETDEPFGELGLLVEMVIVEMVIG